MFGNKNQKPQEPPKQEPSLFGFSRPKPKPDKDKEWEELIWMDEILDDDD